MYADTGKIPFVLFKQSVDGYRVKLTLGPKTHAVFITPFARKCLDHCYCLGCGLLIQSVSAYQVLETSQIRLVFWGERNGKPVRFTRDHITPKRVGGSNDPDLNIEALCRQCNLIKGDSLATRPQLWMLKRAMQLRDGSKKDLFLKVINMGEALYGMRIYA